MEEKLSRREARVKAIGHKAFGSRELKRSRKEENQMRFKIQNCKIHLHKKMSLEATYTQPVAEELAGTVGPCL